MPTYVDPGAPAGPAQTFELPTLGDVATITGPTIVPGAVSVAMATLGSLATINGPNVFLYSGINLPTIGGGAILTGPSIVQEAPPSPYPDGTTIIWTEGAVTYTGVVANDGMTVTVTKEDGVPVANYTYTITDPWFWSGTTIDTTQPIPAVPASDIIPDPRSIVRVCARTDPSVIKATLDETRSKQWQEVVNDAGTGTVSLSNDDPDLAQATFNDYLRFDLDGQAVFLCMIENRNIVQIAQGEEAEEQTQIGGRGILAQWDDATVYPEGGATGRPFSDQRLMNWTSRDYVDSGWGDVMLGEMIGETHVRDPGIAVGFPDGLARVIWAHNASHGGAGSGNAPIGYAYFRKTLNVATSGWYRLFLSADDGAIVIIDGVQIYSDARLWFHLETQFIDIYLTAGQHQFAVRGENLDNETGNPADNSAWILMSVMKLNEDGSLGASILRTDHIGWKAVGYPPKPPGMNVGRVIMTFLAEAQARGALLGWTLAFDDVQDSAGKPWADEPELAFQCGMDLYSVLLQIAESYIEIDTAPAQLVLYAYSDGYGETKAVAYEEGESILSLVHEGTV